MDAARAPRRRRPRSFQVCRRRRDLPAPCDCHAWGRSAPDPRPDPASALWRRRNQALRNRGSLQPLFSLSPLTLLVLPLFLIQDGQEPGDVLPNLLELSRVLQLSGFVLEAQIEELSPRSSKAPLELLDVQLAHLRHLHDCAPPRTRKRVFIGSFWAAKAIASRARSSLTPLISNITRPGLTTATYPAALDLPGHSYSGGLYLPVRDPRRLQRLQPVLAELHLGAALCLPTHPAPVGLPVL